jgi:Mn-dependent DtxR family transcriptional regulator
MIHDQEKEFSESIEMYLKEIYLLSTEESPVKNGAIAERLGVSPPSVTDRISTLQDHGLLVHEKHGGSTLTSEGEAQAERLLRKHCRIERFLVEQLGVTEGFHDEACRLEHAISDDVARRLDRFVDLPDECPDCYDTDAQHCSHLFD